MKKIPIRYIYKVEKMEKTIKTNKNILIQFKFKFDLFTGDISYSTAKYVKGK